MQYKIEMSVILSSWPIGVDILVRFDGCCGIRRGYVYEDIGTGQFMFIDTKDASQRQLFIGYNPVDAWLTDGKRIVFEKQILIN